MSPCYFAPARVPPSLTRFWLIPVYSLAAEPSSSSLARGLLLLPDVDLGSVAALKDGRHLMLLPFPLDDFGSGIYLARGRTTLFHRLVLAENAGQTAGHGIDDGHGRHFPARIGSLADGILLHSPERLHDLERTL